MVQIKNIPAYIIAGGASRRMDGAPKALLPLAGKPVLAHVIARLRPQAAEIILNSNLPDESLAVFEADVLPDDAGETEGPLAGLLTCLIHADRQDPTPEAIATAPCDSPFLPADLIARLTNALGHHDAAIAQSAGRLHPLTGVWRTDVLPELRDGVQREGIRAAHAFIDRIDVAVVEFSEGPIDPFFNINTPEDLARAESLAGKLVR